MAFDEVVFPLKVAYGSVGGICFSTDVVTLEGGGEQRNQNWSAARRVYDALSGVRSFADLVVLRGFFQARCGRARGFRLRDGQDYTSAADGVSVCAATDQQIGVGDGMNCSFQLVKRYGGGGYEIVREIKKPVAGSVVVAVDGVAMANGWNLDATTGLVTFAVPVAAGRIVTAGFLFDVPVRFDTDCLRVMAAGESVAKAKARIVEIRV